MARFAIILVVYACAVTALIVRHEAERRRIRAQREENQAILVRDDVRSLLFTPREVEVTSYRAPFELDLEAPFELQLADGSGFHGITVWTLSPNGGVSVASADFDAPFVSEHFTPEIVARSPVRATLRTIPIRTLGETYTATHVADGRQLIFHVVQGGRTHLTYCSNACPRSLLQLRDAFASISHRLPYDQNARHDIAPEVRAVTRAMWDTARRRPHRALESRTHIVLAPPAVTEEQLGIRESGL